MTTALAIELQSDLEAGRVARSAIAESDPTLPPSVQDDVSLLVTELISNAVRHGGAGTAQPVQLEVRRRNGTIRVQVTDAGTDFAPSSPPVPGDTSGGWGLVLVDRIAQRWGVCSAPAGTCVWFEMPIAATP